MLGIDIQQILLHLLNFVILFTGLYVLLYGPVKKFMDKRTEEYKKMDEDAEEKLANATNLEAEYKEKLSAAEATIRRAISNVESFFASFILLILHDLIYMYIFILISNLTVSGTFNCTAVPYASAAASAFFLFFFSFGFFSCFSETSP